MFTHPYRNDVLIFYTTYITLPPPQVYGYERGDGIGRAHDLIIQGFIRFITLAAIPVVVCAGVLYLLVRLYLSLDGVCTCTQAVLLLHSGRCYKAEICVILFLLRCPFIWYPFWPKSKFSDSGQKPWTIIRRFDRNRAHSLSTSYSKVEGATKLKYAPFYSP